MKSTDDSPQPPLNSADHSRGLCPHCERLGASSVVKPDRESSNILHCTICNLSFHFVTEGSRLVVTQVNPYTEMR